MRQSSLELQLMIKQTPNNVSGACSMCRRWATIEEPWSYLGFLR